MWFLMMGFHVFLVSVKAYEFVPPIALKILKKSRDQSDDTKTRNLVACQPQVALIMHMWLWMSVLSIVEIAAYKH